MVVVADAQDNRPVGIVHSMETVHSVKMAHLVKTVDAHAGKVDADSGYTKKVDVDSCFPVSQAVYR